MQQLNAPNTNQRDRELLLAVLSCFNQPEGNQGTNNPPIPGPINSNNLIPGQHSNAPPMQGKYINFNEMQ